jgi:hypothetical protein
MEQSKRRNKKFEDILINELKKYINNFFKNENQKKYLGQRIKDHLFGKDSSKYDALLAPLTERERFLKEIFDDYYEILMSFENMKMISIFVRQYPNYKSYKNQKINKTKYLRYHIENYLNEIYIFEKRIEAFLNKLIKKLKSKQLNKEIDRINKLKDILYKSLEKAKDARGAHVHKYRFTNNKISQLNSLELFADIGGLKILSFYKDWEYKQLRNEWAKIINENNNELQKLLDYILEGTKPIVFDKLIFYYKNRSKN